MNEIMLTTLYCIIDDLINNINKHCRRAENAGRVEA